MVFIVLVVEPLDDVLLSLDGSCQRGGVFHCQSEVAFISGRAVWGESVLRMHEIVHFLGSFLLAFLTLEASSMSVQDADGSLSLLFS